MATAHAHTPEPAHTHHRAKNYRQLATKKHKRHKTSFASFVPFCGNNAIVVVDGSESKRFRHELKSYLIRRLKDDSSKCFIKNVRVLDSTTTNLLQLADMVVGAVARSFSEKKDACEYRSLIDHRETNVEVWPN